MADEFNFQWSQIQNYIEEADADLIPVPGQLELHGRCTCGVLLSMLWCSLFVAGLIMGIEELELHCRYRGRFDFRKIRIATIVRRVVPETSQGRGLPEVLQLFEGNKSVRGEELQRESPFEFLGHIDFTRIVLATST